MITLESFLLVADLHGANYGAGCGYTSGNGDGVSPYAGTKGDGIGAGIVPPLVPNRREVRADGYGDGQDSAFTAAMGGQPGDGDSSSELDTDEVY